MQDKTGWELSIGLYPGILFGFRSYASEGVDSDGDEYTQTIHVVYVPFLDVSLSIYRY
jgi:hypothetical protein